MKYQSPKGTKDIFYDEVNLWQFIEQVALETFNLANFKEIRTPIFEYTELFARGVGESTDIVNKEMYTFTQQERNYSLRPENTAGVVRAYIQNGLFKKPSPQKLWYKGPMFRYERPQSGRQRQFHQIGAEMFGIPDASADAEVIITAIKLFKKLGLTGLTLGINNIGCPECRNDFKNKLKDSLKNNLTELCADCQTRYNTNPLRLLDCKVEKCQEIFSKEPTNSIINDKSGFICDKCQKQYEELKEILKTCNIQYITNNKLVRGLDYYNGTVFEISSENLGAQNAICGGGRYDSLIKMLGGPDTYAVGWAFGVERTALLLKEQESKAINVYIASIYSKEALLLADTLRSSKISTELNFGNAKIGKQLEKANKLNAQFAVIIGEEELKNQTYTVKNLSTGNQFTYGLADTMACLIENTRK